MADLVRKFATRVLLLHFLAFIVVLALVAGAAFQLYQDTRAQLLKNAIARRELLVGQTSRAIAEFFDGIIDNLDLIRRSEGDEPADLRERAGNQIFRRIESGDAPRDLQRLRDNLGPGRGLRPPGERPLPPLPATRPRSEVNPKSQGSLDLLPSPSLIPSPSLLLTGQLTAPRPPAEPPTSPNLRAALPISQALWRQLENRATHLFTVDPSTLAYTEIGRSATALPTSTIANSLRTFIPTVTRPRVSPAVKLDAHTFVAVCAPINITNGQRRILCAVVPLEEISSRFLDELSAARNIYFAIYDDTNQILATSDANIPNVSRSIFTNQTPFHSAPLTSSTTTRPANSGTPPMINSYVMESGIRTQSGSTIDPMFVVIADIDIEGPDWVLVVATPLREVDNLVAGIFQRTILWSTFLVLATAGLLISTATRLIQARLRLERERSASLTRELDQARKIQLDWLPSPFSPTPTLQLAAENVPASHVSGDFYNWFTLPPSPTCPRPRTAIVIGDVTGHGMSAALMMSTVQLLIRSALERLHDPGLALTQVNATLCLHDFSGQFVTVLLAILDPATGEVLLSTAGHPHPILLTPNSPPNTLNLEPELMLAVQPDTQYPTQSHTLPGPASLVLYTDGLPEALSPSGSLFTLPATLNALSKLPPSATPTEINSSLIAAITTHRQTSPLLDDLTLVTLRYSPPSR